MDNKSESLGERLKKLRAKKGLSVKDVAITIGVPVTTYREWENGRKIVGEPYKQLADILGVSLFELITGEKMAAHSVIDSISCIEDELQKIKNYLLSKDHNERGITGS